MGVKVNDVECKNFDDFEKKLKSKCEGRKKSDTLYYYKQRYLELLKKSQYKNSLDKFEKKIKEREKICDEREKRCE